MTGKATHPRNPTLKCIASWYRRESLLALNRWGPTLSVRQLAEYLAAADRNTSSPSPTDIEAMQLQLTHVHLPALETARLISWEQSEGVVQTETHPALDDPRFEQILKLTGNDVDAILSALSHDYRRIGLTVLEADRMMSRTELAHKIHQRLSVTAHRELPSTEEISLSLHHAHLPVLDEIDVVDFDSTTGGVSYVDNPVLERVFTIIFERDDSAVEKLDGFLDGLADSYQEASRGKNSQTDWPHFWNDPYYG